MHFLVMILGKIINIINKFRVMSTDKSYDIGFDIVTIICLIMFSVEIFLACFARIGYLGSFFFWLDFISTISLILDI